VSQLLAAPAVDPSQWTAIVPAAGRGSRLGFEKPKILYPVAGRMIVEWLLDFLLPNCETIVFVLSPGGRAAVETELARLIPGRYRIAIQEVPTGMGDAVALGLEGVTTKHVAIVWGDQVALRRESVDACLRIQQGALEPDLTCPTVIRRDPYIHFPRDARGNISGLRQKREGDAMPAEGESDTGFFCFRTASLRHYLEKLRESSSRGNATGEFNFLPIIPLAAKEGVVVTPHMMTLEETVGVNSIEDAALLEPILGRHRQDQTA
jgi:bifunctional N-acetylglucosamine-1-phosphate-uridyltransferase/glucosamine-1-phosphate-acetyltransferase GlmU-like protein